MSVTASASSVGAVLFIMGGVGLAIHNQSLLMALLHLEICNLATFLILMSNLSNSVSPAILILFLCLLVSEAAIGLAVLVMMARCHGSDYMTSVGVLSF
uniref:NADH-ubiquinone oxidoreductase chain 4L n=1 Tax=Nipponacmea fuscoviridis TaxID=225302 RepID=A0A6B9Q8U9_9GAST|nr:NADH dehydrogenase subunit 4L [Nipponacmea fuscoviridis]QHE50288.1 NADH dehydrogenase subunit 4L [Nipponacmea fuscoviridis]QVH34241.1 NADH dehydrogenase subunit 4L [Nipponacmea fuscoviridis]